jgi:hypothetical protein
MVEAPQRSREAMRSSQGCHVLVAFLDLFRGPFPRQDEVDRWEIDRRREQSIERAFFEERF